MLKNIKASFFLKVLFSHTSEGQKLKIARYSKYSQKILDRNLINYKLFSDKYIIYESDGKGKEYDYRGHLLFEGEYLNGKRNGKGKEYGYLNDLLFEGEYLNGKRNGKGKEYDFHGIISFSGEYLNGEKSGQGCEYFDGKLSFSGE